MLKRSICFAVVICMLFSALPMSVSAATNPAGNRHDSCNDRVFVSGGDHVLSEDIVHALDPGTHGVDGEPDQTPASSFNKNGYDYVNASRWATPVYSYLRWEDHGYIRVEAIGTVVTVERYNEHFQLISRLDLPMELPIFGGAYLCDDYNFVVVGQDNEEEDDATEVIRVICYTKDWERVGAASLYGANTIHPFEAGSLRFARMGDMLIVRTCHEMYASSDGLNHQANMTVCVDIPTMQITHSYPYVAYNPFGYVSHSFNQFILVDGNYVLTLDHGDAYPRSVVMHRTDFSSGVPSGWYSLETIDVFPIADSTGHYNDTGVAVGGFASSDTHYLAVGNSTSQAGGIDFWGYQRNIFITATPKDQFSEEATKVTWITDYDEGADVSLGTPILTQLQDGRFFLMWRVQDRIN